MRSILLLLLPLLCSCSEEQLPEGAQLSLIRQRLHLRTTSVAFGFNSELTQSIVVEGENTPWTISGLPDWLSASPVSGNGAATITLTAKENASVDESKMALLTFSSTASDYQFTKSISVSQPVAQVYITPSETSISFKAAGETKTLTINSNVEWSAKSSESWLTVEKVNSTQLRIAAKENLANKTNTASIQLMRSGTTTTIFTIAATQTEAGVTGSADEIVFSVDGEMKTTSINAEASWTAYSYNSSWISVTPASGSAGSKTLTITTTANNSSTARSGYVYVRIGTTDKLSIPISQEGISYTTSKSSLTLKSTSETVSFTIESNTSSNWSVISKPEWLEVKPASGGKGSTTIVVTPKDNPNTTSRSGSIILGRDGFSGNQTITVKQEGKSFAELVNTMEFPTTSSQQSVTIETDGQWIATTSESWIHLSPMSGQGRGTLQISADENAGKEERTGKVTVTVGQTAQTINIIQVGRYINISSENQIKDSNPTTIQLTVASSLSWTVTSDAAWLTVSPTSGTGNATLTLTVADNPSTKARSATISFATADETIALSFTQPGRSLTISSTTLSFTSEGGTSQAITVTTDGSYSISSSASWLTYKQSGNTFTVTAAENTGAARTGSIIVALTGLSSGESLQRTISVSQNKYVAPDPLGLCPDAAHPHQIDMGTGVKFACCNVGASSPVEYGDYFAWGETKTKSNYDWSTYSLCRGSSSTMTKYCNNSSYGTVDYKTKLELTDDAARANWGSPWRMPTIEELTALNDKCTWTWTTISNVAGYKVTSTNGNILFFPAAGYRDEASLNDAGSNGVYWSSSLNTSDADYARGLGFRSSRHFTSSGNYRYRGRSVRPVTE